MKKSLIRVLAGLLFATAALVSAAPPPPDPRAPGLHPEERLRALVERVRLEQEALQSLQADFEQSKVSALLLEPQEASGTFAYRTPEEARWEFTAPTPISLLISDGQMTTWYRDLDRAETLDVTRFSSRALEFLGAGNSLGTLLSYFEVVLHMPDDETLPYQLDLTPQYERVAKKLQSLILWIDPAVYLPTRIRYVEVDGDTTEYSFHRMRINEEVPADRFILELPPGVEVTTVSFGRPGKD